MRNNEKLHEHIEKFHFRAGSKTKLHCAGNTKSLNIQTCCDKTGLNYRKFKTHGHIKTLLDKKKEYMASCSASGKFEI